MLFTKKALDSVVAVKPVSLCEVCCDNKGVYNGLIILYYPTANDASLAAKCLNMKMVMKKKIRAYVAQKN